MARCVPASSQALPGTGHSTHSGGTPTAGANCIQLDDIVLSAAPTCLRILTGTDFWDDGTLDVEIDQGNGYMSITSGQRWEVGQMVVDDCFPPLLGVRVTNPTNNGWVGSVEISEGGTYLPLLCTEGCTVSGSTASIVSTT